MQQYDKWNEVKKNISNSDNKFIGYYIKKVNIAKWHTFIKKKILVLWYVKIIGHINE